MVPVTVSSRAERAEDSEYVASNLVARAAVLVRLLVKEVRSREVSRTEGEVLAILSEGPRRVTELAELVGLAQPTMTLLVRRLEERSWVERAGLPDDGRVVIVEITAAGQAAFEEFRARFRAAVHADLAGLSDRQLAELRAATQTLGSFVDSLQAEGGS